MRIALAVVFALLPGPRDGFRAGAAAVDVTPTKFPVIVNGSFVEKTASEAKDRLWARALVLDDGAIRVAIAVVDSCMMPRRLIDEAKELASRETGIPVDRMLVSATHTHSAPASMGCLGSDADPEYPGFLKPRIAEAIARAAADLAPAEAGWAVAAAPEHTFCRRWILRPDKVRQDPFGQSTVRANMHPGYQHPDFIGPSGPVDPDLTMLALRSRAGKPIAALANYSMHYFGAAPVSADYFGVFVSKLEAAVGGGIAMMSQGTSGDQMWMDYGKPRAQTSMASYAEALARIAAEAHRGIAYRAGVSLAMREAKLALGRRVADGERLAWAREAVAKLAGQKPKTQQEIYAREQVMLAEEPRAELKLQALRVGELGITAIPNEVFAITGLKVKAMSPLAPTMSVELANGAEGYIPPPEQHRLGGYTTWAARTAGLEVEAEPKIVEAVVKLLEEVSGKPRRPFVEPDGAYAKAVLASKPAAWFRLGEFGPPLSDSAAGRKEARLEGGGAYALEGPDLPGFGSVNRCVHLAGGRLRLDSAALGRDTHTVELWFWNGLPADARPAAGYLLSNGWDRVDGARGSHVGIGGTHRPETKCRLFFYDGREARAGSTEVPLKTWNHLVYVRIDAKVAVYLNGRLEVSCDAPRRPDAHGGGERTGFFVGGRSDGFSNFEGKIDEVAVYDRGLTADEAAAHFRAAGP